MNKFTKEQPLDGETILHCGHANEPNSSGKFHWWKFAHEVYFKRPDDSVGTAIWLCACENCCEKAQNNPLKIEIKGDSIWVGNDPHIIKNEK